LAVTAFAVVAVTVGLATVVLLVRGGEPGVGSSAAAPAPSASAATPAMAARIAGLTDLTVHQGETATIRYRVVVGTGSAFTVTLVITDRAGEQVKALRLADGASAGAWQRAVVQVRLAPGRDKWELRLSGPGVASPAPSPAPQGSASAALRVLPPLPPAYPGHAAVAATTDWLSRREGEVAFAVVDTNGEEAGGYRRHEPFQLASLSKAILLVASVRDDPMPDAASEAELTAMIEESDNGAAYAIFGRVGAEGMRAVAKASRLRDYEQGSGWVDTRDSAADQARFFSELESLVPSAGRELARRLLSGVVPIQRWGIPAAAGPEGWTSYFKGGWLGKDNTLMVQAAWLEKGKKKWALAVMSDENATRSFGRDTQKGVTGLLLGQEPTPTYLAVVLE
jgi:hypothetical protein